MRDKTTDFPGEIVRRPGITYYHQLHALLAAALNDGTIPAGSALPSETELMQRFEVSRNTVRRALGQLEKEKRIIRRRGSGSYARSSPPVALSLDTVVDVVHSLDTVKARISNRLLRVQATETPDFVRRKEAQFGEKSLLIQRCHMLKGIPFALTTSYVPAHLAANLSRSKLTRHAALIALDAAGLNPVSAEQWTTAVVADTVIARHLKVEPASALLCLHRLIRNGQGQAIEHQSHLFPHDRFQLRSRWTLKRSEPGLRWANTHTADMPAWL